MLTKIKVLFQGDLAKRLAKNSSLLLGGDVIGSALRMISIVITARYLGPEPFGILILIQAYVGVVDRLVNFQSWQAIIRYGVASIEENRKSDLNSLFKFCFLLDLGTALLGTLVAIGMAPLIGIIFKWDQNVVHLSMIYGLVILLNITGTPIGVLRLFNRFDLLAAQHVLSGSFKIVGVGIAFLMKASMPVFLLIWMLTTVLEYLLFLWFAWREIRGNPELNIWKSSLKDCKQKHPGLIGFVISTNLQGAIRMSSRELDTLVVGGLLGVAASGLYKIAKLFSLVLSKLMEPLYQSIYPELARLWSGKQFPKFLKLIFYSGLFGGILPTFIWIFFVIFGKTILILTVGPAYLDAYPLLIWYMVAILISLYGLPLLPALLAMGKPHANLVFDGVSAIIYFVTLIYFIHWFGVIGVSPAYVVYYLVWSLLMIGYGIWILQQRNIISFNKNKKKVDLISLRSL